MEKLIYTPLNLEQRSDDWLEWRKSGIGASEASVIMGSLPFEFEDILDLWKKKAGLPMPEFIVTEAIQQGIDTEDEALARFTEVSGIEMIPKCFTHPTYSYLRASLDGINKDLTEGVEIKCPGTTKYYQAKKGIVVSYYYTQVQQQMACSGLQSMNYWVYRKKEGGVWIKIPRNEEYIQELYRRATIFWELLQARKPCLPKDLGINPYLEIDPFITGEHTVEFIDFYKN